MSGSEWARAGRPRLRVKLTTLGAVIEVAVAVLMSGCNGCNNTPVLQQVWVADSQNNRVLDFSALNPINGVATDANQVVGQPNFTSNSANAGAAISAQGLDSPRAVAFDNAGNMWVADTSNNRVLGFAKDPNSAFSGVKPSASTVIGQANFSSGQANFGKSSPNKQGFDQPWALAFDPGGNLWVADNGNCRILEFQPPFPANSASASVVIGQVGQSSFGTTCTYRGTGPVGMAFDGSGDLFASYQDATDSGAAVVIEFKAPLSSGMPPSATLTSNICSGGPGGNKDLCSPGGLAVDKSGNLWVADVNGDRVLEFPPPYTSGASLILGQPNFTSGQANWCPLPCTPSVNSPTATGFGGPRGVAVDGVGNVFVSDSANNRVVEFSPPLSNGKAATLVLGQGSLTANGAGSSQNAINTPTGLAAPGSPLF